MKKEREIFTVILFQCLIIFGIQSCSKTTENVDISNTSHSQTDSANNSSTPILKTIPITIVTTTSATSGGNITNKGSNFTIVSSGVCWSTTSNPTLSNHIVTSGSGDSTTFLCTMNNLPSVYYVRAFATNSGGFTGYGNEVTNPITPAGYTFSTPIVLSGQSNLTIQGLYIANTPGIGISLTNCHDMTITRCIISHTLSYGIYLNSCYNIRITHCEIDSVQSGLYAKYCTDGIDFNYNDTKNILGPLPQAQMVQFNQCSGANDSVSYNTCDNVPGYSHPEDIISMWESTGTADSPIQIIGNKIRGGGPSTTGGGIMLGDTGGGYQIASNNILVDPGEYGIAISGGNNSVIENNLIYGRSQPFTNVGLYLWNENALPCGNNTLQNNRVNFRYPGGLNDFFNGSSTPDGSFPICTGTVWQNNVDDQTLNASILPEVLFGTNK